ncbi:MAG: N-acetylmuramoyl-L-alanine amidase [Candidatus Riflebacteria bacterium]|nr:N-acetylmuramoyl-L-alanine amidase [Candidatus Riflebacteria bacterium]
MVRKLISMASIFIFISQVAFSQDNRITDIRFWQSPEEAQIVFDLSWTPAVSPVRALEDGTFFFDIENGNFRPGQKNFMLNNSFISQLKVQEIQGAGVRIAFKLPPSVQYKNFLLPKAPQKPDRIVIMLSESQTAQAQRRQDEKLEIAKLKAQNIKIVLIDPGHGGEDPGATHNGIVEKDYVLRMGKLIKSFFDRDPRYKAVLSRSGDYIIPLQRRSQIAEQLGADVFVSVHANYNSKRCVRGTEVYYESPRGAIGEAERQIADQENQQDAIGGVYESINPSANKPSFWKQQASTMFKSRQLAEKMSRRLAYSNPGLPNAGVKRAGFKVLHSVALPSILVELGYTSNNQDAWYLKDQNGQMRLAQGVYLGVRDFLEGRIQEGFDTNYLQYAMNVESAKRAEAERSRRARERRASLLRNSKIYKVKKGETLKTVASKFNVGVSTLSEVNNLGKRKKLKAGEVIRIPSLSAMVIKSGNTNEIGNKVLPEQDFAS